ncbi:beta-fructosidase [Anaerolinea thermolimosa]|uniref:family 43 glycosylhydrolase n=1 Tax=Anaerolinea thermolimosa TaxID=229919 RepID=UPI000A5C91C6|nr:family 43 glycosylhydrolase [Anaerolinea thermolimosa]GAP05192.1 beta-fructosidase [Anaerolinea thermolimosa]
MDRETYLKNVKPTSAGWIKYSGNPVMGGDLGTCFDISMMEQDGRYRMWFSWRPKKSLAYTESTDGIHWDAPVIVLSPRETSEGWEQDLNRPAVVLCEGVYHMWYTGQLPGKLPRAVDGRSWLFYATSIDGLNWQRASLKPVLSAEEPWEKVALMSPHVIWDDKERLFKMWYSGGEQYEPNAIGYATSRDGLHWDKYPANPIFTADPSHQWEQHKVAACQIYQKNDWFLMFYIGYFDEDTAQIGIARSRDGITGWERHPQNPIIAPSVGEWDGEACYKPFALFDGAMWRLWYNGRNGTLEQIGLATHEGEDLGFPEQ